MEGFNASKLYEMAGTYTITLTVTNEAGETSSTSSTVTVTADTRSSLYIAANGNDDNDGSSQASPVATLARASELVSDHTNILLRRGDIFDATVPLSIGHVSNVHISSYGQGSAPVLMGSSGQSWGAAIELTGNLSGVVITDLEFTSPTEPSLEMPYVQSAILAFGENLSNLTIQNCSYDNVGTAVGMYTDDVEGLLIAHNRAEILGIE